VTKVRPPLTFENALAQVAGHIGWNKVAEIVGQAERTIRNWSEPDTTTRIPLEAALKLDEHFHKAGGEGAPFFFCYMTRLELAKLAACPGREQLLASIAASAREAGEALAAALDAAEPDADRADFAIGERELEEAIAALQKTLAATKARREAFEEGRGLDSELRVQGGTQPVTV
jgi:hypothetical protein